MTTVTSAAAAGRGAQLQREGIAIRAYDRWKSRTMGDGAIHAVAGVDGEMRRGEYVAIMGPYGSTLMNPLGCLDSPVTHEAGMPTARSTLAEARRQRMWRGRHER
jgi:ABC-type lipoprotein export system ATPase subunit